MIGCTHVSLMAHYRHNLLYRSLTSSIPPCHQQLRWPHLVPLDQNSTGPHGDVKGISPHTPLPFKHPIAINVSYTFSSNLRPVFAVDSADLHRQSLPRRAGIFAEVLGPKCKCSSLICVSIKSNELARGL